MNFISRIFFVWALSRSNFKVFPFFKKHFSRLPSAFISMIFENPLRYCEFKYNSRQKKRSIPSHSQVISFFCVKSSLFHHFLSVLRKALQGETKLLCLITEKNVNTKKLFSQKRMLCTENFLFHRNKKVRFVPINEEMRKAKNKETILWEVFELLMSFIGK